MPLFRWIKSLLSSGDAAPKRALPQAEAPTPEEWASAKARLDALVKPAVLGEIGGGRPQPENRASSWWGCNFLAAPGETVPICARSGRAMHPVLQIRVDELPETPAPFEGLALVNIWLDLQSKTMWGPRNGDGFFVRAYSSLDGLVPIGCGYRDGADLPSFSVFWRDTVPEQPGWEDMSGEVPPNVARAADDDWFFKSPYLSDRYNELRSKHPVKLGGWPTWIQGASWPKDAQFVLQVDATDKGKLHLGDAGSFYVFRTSTSWEIRGDCY